MEQTILTSNPDLQKSVSVVARCLYKHLRAINIVFASLNDYKNILLQKEFALQVFQVHLQYAFDSESSEDNIFSHYHNP